MKVGVVDIDERISSHLKEELAWAIGKQLQIISTIKCYSKTVRVLTKELKELKNKAI